MLLLLFRWIFGWKRSGYFDNWIWGSLTEVTVYVLECNAVYASRNSPTFQKNILFPFSRSNTEPTDWLPRGRRQDMFTLSRIFVYIKKVRQNVVATNMHCHYLSSMFPRESNYVYRWRNRTWNLIKSVKYKDSSWLLDIECFLQNDVKKCSPNAFSTYPHSLKRLVPFSGLFIFVGIVGLEFRFLRSAL
jgi:hypothetical protein